MAVTCPATVAPRTTDHPAVRAAAARLPTTRPPRARIPYRPAQVGRRVSMRWEWERS